MNNLLHIPALAADIPATIVPNSARKRSARLARCLLDAKVIQGSVSALAARDPAKVCQSHLQRWIEEQLVPMQCLSPGFNLYIGQRALAAYPPQEADEDDKDAQLAWFAKPDCWVIGPALERLEQVLPGLGATVLTVMEEQSWRVMPLFTPWEAGGIAQEIYWHGETDEELAIEESCGDDKEAQAAMREEMVTKEMLEADYPAWAIKWRKGRKVIAQRRLPEIAASVSSPKVRAVIEDTITLSRLALDEQFKPDHDGWFDGYAAVLCWNRGDITVRVYDDYSHYVWEGGEAYDSIGEHQIQLDGAAEFNAWAEAMQPRFAAMRLIDRLIHSLSTGDWRRVPKGFR